MKLKFITMYLLVLVSVVFGCKNQDDDIVFDFSPLPELDFVEMDLFYSKQIILNANIDENQMQLLSAGIFYKLDANGMQTSGGGGFHFTSLSYFIKHCLSKNYLAMSSPSDRTGIRFHSTGNNDFFSNDISLSVGRIGTDSLASNIYESLNFGFDNVAISDYNETLLPVVKSSNPDEIAFVLFNLKSFIDSAYLTNYAIPVGNYKEITLPQEPTNQINRIEFFQQNFYVSTTENTYLIRPDGTFKLLSVGSADDFFEYDEKIYADFGNRIGFTSDDGETWEEKNNTPTFDGFREFQEGYGNLVFFYEDELYRVNPDDFSYSSLKNKGLEGSKITAVMPFRESIYVATLSGLFYKSIEELK